MSKKQRFLIDQDPFLTKRKGIVGYLARIFVSVDQLVNVIFGGDEDETISSRIAKDQRRGRKFACFLCKLLDIIDKNHCEKAIEKDEGKRPGQYDKPK
jgi:hypothetical protein